MGPILAIHSKRVLLPDGLREATVLVAEGKILEVREGGGQEEGVVELGDLVLMPGVIDPHVHINEPGRTEWEGFDTATRAALAGGLTALVDMPLNSSPVTTTSDAFEHKLAAASGQLHCNCGFWGGVVPGNEKEIEGLIHKGVPGFKGFLTHSGIDEFPNVTETDLHKVMPVLAYHGLPLLVHCELSEPLPPASQAGDPRSYQHYLASRPPKWEDDAIALLIRLCSAYQCRTHIVHLSSAGSIPQILRAKEKGLPLTVETAQHYLYFSAEEIPDGLTSFKCAPPIRSRQNNEQLWDALLSGLIDFVATDHSPAPPSMKAVESGDLMQAWGGIASTQFALSALWTAARKRGCAIDSLRQWCNEGPAALIGESDRRGRIARGYVADLAAWDPEASFVVREEDILHRHKVTPYLGERLWGRVQACWLEGVLVYEEGQLRRPGEGKVILRRE